MTDVLLSDVVLEPLALLAALLALAYLYARRRDAAKRAPRRPKVSPRPHPSQTRPRQPPPKQTHPAPQRAFRSQRERVIDLHRRGAIFTATEAGQIDGYILTELGELRVDGGPEGEARLKRAAAQRFEQANALVKMRMARVVQRVQQGNAPDGTPLFQSQEVHEWRAMAVQAHPMHPNLCPPKAYRDDLVLIDGSNVMNWEVDAGLAETPSLRPLHQVLDALKAKGVAAGVVFDATAGHRLEGRFLGHDALAARLPSAADVLVVDKGTQADWVLVDMARSDGLIIISNDHFRDAPPARHLLKQKGYVEAGGVRLLAPRA